MVPAVVGGGETKAPTFDNVEVVTANAATDVTMLSEDTMVRSDDPSCDPFALVRSLLFRLE